MKVQWLGFVEFFGFFLVRISPKAEMNLYYAWGQSKGGLEPLLLVRDSSKEELHSYCSWRTVQRRSCTCIAREGWSKGGDAPILLVKGSPKEDLNPIACLWTVRRRTLCLSAVRRRSWTLKTGHILLKASAICWVKGWYLNSTACQSQLFSVAFLTIQALPHFYGMMQDFGFPIETSVRILPHPNSVQL